MKTNPIVEMDVFLICKTRSISDSFYHLFDITHWQLALTFLNISSACFIIFTIEIYRVSHHTWSDALSSAIPFLINLLFYNRWHKTLMKQKRHKHSVSLVIMSEHLDRIISISVSIIVLIWLLALDSFHISPESILLIVSNFAFDAHLYFKTATPPPPKINKKLALQIG